MAISCVGIGMLLGAHLTPRARHLIERADIVFSNVSDGIVELWLATLNANTRSLQPHYVPGRSRKIGYEAMVEDILEAARSGKDVCAAFYGHPGVFAWVAHEVLRRAREQGIAASMEAGVSAADCLYADLGIDPGEFGCQHYEATQLMIYDRRIDATAYLVVWQVAMAGDRTLTRLATGAAYRQLLVDVLAQTYPRDHRCLLYRAATLPIDTPRRESLRLCDLPDAHIELPDTLVLPPAQPLRRNAAVRQALDQLDAL